MLGRGFASLLLLVGLAVTGCGEALASPDDTGRVDVDSGAPPPDARTDSGGPGVDSGHGSDSGAPGDSGSMDAGSIGDVDAGRTVGIICGTATCGSGELCCVTRSPGGMMISETCTAPGACAGAALSCDGPEDCTSTEACCGSALLTGGAMCVPQASCTRGRLCHATTDCAGADTCCAVLGRMICSPVCRP